MCNKAPYLVSLVLLLGATAGASANALVAHWTFDEGTGTTASDASGNNNHGTLNGDPQWVPGPTGGALEFDGDGDYVVVENNPGIQLLASDGYSVAAYVNISNADYGVMLLHGLGCSTWASWFLGVEGGEPDASRTPNMFIFGVRTGSMGGYTGVMADVVTGDWVFLAVTHDGTTLTFYVDGEERDSVAAPLPYDSAESLHMGGDPGCDGRSWYTGQLDEVYIFSREMNAGQVQDLANGILPAWVKAEKPSPADGARGVDTPLFQWAPGDGAVSHNVYLGIDPDNLTFIGPQGWTVYWHMPGLEAGVTYYWRIDEKQADGTVVTGDVWSFTAAPATAFDPVPCDGMKWVETNVVTAWSAGIGASSHDVYFGTDETAVASADPSVFVHNTEAREYEPGPLVENTTYYWRIDEQSLTGVHEGAVWSFTTAGPLPANAGLKALYFNNIDLSGVASLVRIDPEVDFVWGDPGGPGAPIGVDGFSARWIGEIDIPSSGAYTFSTNTDDGIRVWVDEQRIIENWTEHGPTIDTSRPIELAAGRYAIRVEYFENTGGATCQLYWESPCIVRQIIPAAALSPPLRASNPKPADESAGAKDTPTLSWTPGEKAAQHDVYVGTDRDTVAAADTSAVGIYRGRQLSTKYLPPEAPLEWETTIYWRIDEVNGLDIWPGNVWSFTVADYIIVDDFEDYNDYSPDRIFQTWIDGFGYTDPPPGKTGNGTGSTVGYLSAPFAEQTIVHGGAGQSMPFGYDNTGAGGKSRYSEAEREWLVPQNFNRNGVKAMTLYFYGNPPAFMEDPPGTYKINGGGADVWGGSDEFRYVYKQLSGDGEIIARVVSIGGPSTNEWRKAGVMIRQTLDPASLHAFMAVTPTASHGLAFQYRDGIDADDSDSEHGVDDQTAPYWVKLVREGDQFTAYHSPDGIDWTMKDPGGDEADAMNPVTIPMDTTVYIGLAVLSHDAAEMCLVEFTDVSTSGSVSGAWQVADIGVEQSAGNTPERMYVALQDSTGANKMVHHDSLGATGLGGWNEWNIELTEFAPVNLNSITKMYIGVGDRLNPMIGGTGNLFIDDIRLYRPRCIPSEAQPENDLSGNCIVDLLDVEIMAGEWLAAPVVADLDGDGDVDFADYADLADTWLDEALWPAIP